MKNQDAENIVERMIRYYQEKGMAFTNNRLLVAAKLWELDEYVDAVDLWILLKEEQCSISIGCVYLNLKLMVKLGLAYVKKEDRQFLFRINPAA